MEELRYATVEKIAAAIYGSAVGDALGVPFECSNRFTLMAHPVQGMAGNLMYRQPAGTWSDDTSMTLCLMESIWHAGYNPRDVMRQFCDWYYNAKFTATGVVFDAGGACSNAIYRFHEGKAPLFACADSDESTNGNGALMRIMPLLFFCLRKYGIYFIRYREAREQIREITQLTHGHPRCVMANYIYLCIAEYIYEGVSPNRAVYFGLEDAWRAARQESEIFPEWQYFERLWPVKAFQKLPVDEIPSTGYVVHTLEAAIWCFLTTDSYKSCVLKAVNLGGDTDTVGAVAGGLAGLHYGLESIPALWRRQLQNEREIFNCCSMLSACLEKSARLPDWKEYDNWKE